MGCKYSDLYILIFDVWGFNRNIMGCKYDVIDFYTIKSKNDLIGT